MKKNLYSPESLMMSYGHDPIKSGGSIKIPAYLSSTFVFKSAEKGKRFFEVAYGLRNAEDWEEEQFSYSRISNPNLEVFESRLALWDKAESCVSFSSGMAAISTVFSEFLKPGDILIYSSPTYGGTDYIIHNYLASNNITLISVDKNHDIEQLRKQLQKEENAHKVAMIYLETPSNPTNDLFDIEAYKDLAKSCGVGNTLLVVDNTFMGPVWSSPIRFGADLVIYSATKYIGGHSDLMGGAVLGKSHLIDALKKRRTYLGNMMSAHSAWLFSRSLETLKVRMEQQEKTASVIANYLNTHNAISKVYYPGLLQENTPQYHIFKKQYTSGGAMISFEIKGDEKDAFKFINNLNLIKIAVSLGSNESLVEHPASMTHAGVSPENKLKWGITDNLVRLSIGLENLEDLIADLANAFEIEVANLRKRKEPIS